MYALYLFSQGKTKLSFRCSGPTAWLFPKSKIIKQNITSQKNVFKIKLDFNNKINNICFLSSISRII